MKDEIHPSSFGIHPSIPRRGLRPKVPNHRTAAGDVVFSPRVRDSWPPPGDPCGWPAGPISCYSFPSAKADRKDQHDTAAARANEANLRLNPAYATVNPAGAMHYAIEGTKVRPPVIGGLSSQRWGVLLHPRWRNKRLEEPAPARGLSEVSGRVAHRRGH